MLGLSETDARGSDESPCRAYHPMTFPRDGHLPCSDAIGSGEFPAKPAVTVWGGVDEMGPWLRVRDTDCLLLCDRTVHWSSACPLIPGRSFRLMQCYCVDKLHRCFHYDVDDTFCLHGNSRCSAAKTWTLRQGWYGLSWSCVGGAAPFLRDHPDSFRVVTMPWHSLRWNFPPELVSFHFAVGQKRTFVGWVAFSLAGLIQRSWAAMVAKLLWFCCFPL